MHPPCLSRPVPARPLAVLTCTLLMALSTSTLPARADTPQTAVLTNHNDNLRTGQNLTETVLTTSNVATASFGEKYTTAVDGAVYAQPLYIPALALGDGTTHNVVYVATEHDSVYALDADSGAILWHSSFLDPQHGITPLSTSAAYGTPTTGDISPEIGITSTPVIDAASGTIYVVAATAQHRHYYDTLHALDITTGAEKLSGPTVISAAVSGHGIGNVGGIISFQARHENQRAALLLSNGTIYIAWASFGDLDPYHGWVMAYNASTLAQVGVYNTTPDGSEGGIWQSGGGLAADAAGNIYGTVGNGTFGVSHHGRLNTGESVFKLTLNQGLSVTDSFTPFNESCLEPKDYDFGSGGTLLLPDQTNTTHPQLLLSGGKEGRLYLLDRTDLGGFVSTSHPCTNQKVTTVDKTIQEFPPKTVRAIFSTPAYWAGAAGGTPFVYINGEADTLRAFSVVNGLLSATPTSQTPETYYYPGTEAAISSNGNMPGTGIVWTIGSSGGLCKSDTADGCQPQTSAVFRAYDATDLGKELYSSTQNTSRDKLGTFNKFSVPTIADGKVFVATNGALSMFGLLN